MQQNWWYQWSAWVVLIIGIILTALCAYIRQRNIQRKAQVHKTKLQEARNDHETKLIFEKAVLEKDLNAISEFLKDDGLRQLLGFFKDTSSPKNLLILLSKISEMDKNFSDMNSVFQKVKNELESMRGMLSERLFNPVTARIHDGIESNQTFASRLKEKSDSKMYLKNHWINIELVQNILSSEDSIFIESGSTLAYCMLSIIENISKSHTSEKPLRVCTNNVAIYMMLLFQEHLVPVLLPGRPNNPYAATFGDIDENGNHGDLIKDFLEEHKVNVLFTTASYLDIEYGPHVGSIQNHAMKGILNDYSKDTNHNRKNIFVIVAEKINRDVSDKKIDAKCKLIFDPARTENVLLNSEVLDKTKRSWEDHLRNSNNYIISGSSDASICTSKIDEFMRQHKTQAFLLPIDGGLIFKLPSR